MIFSSLRCEVLLTHDLLRIPTLMQVRWVNSCDDSTYLCGLQYLV